MLRPVSRSDGGAVYGKETGMSDQQKQGKKSQGSLQDPPNAVFLMIEKAFFGP